MNLSEIQKLLRDKGIGVDIITANAEYGPGQMEINFAPAWDIAAADHAFTFKNGVKEIALQHGMIASFMTKPHIDQSASGCHYHQSPTGGFSKRLGKGQSDARGARFRVCQTISGGQTS